MKEVTVAMVALGGYGNFYLRALFNAPPERNIRFVAGIDPNPVSCRYLEQFKAANIPIYPDLESFYAESSADLVMIAAPIHLHLPFTKIALDHGSNVLCEKPIAGTIQEARAMVEAAANADGFIGIGYQWSFARAIQALKQDIMDGTLGKPLRLRTKVLWPRPISYYHRNSWAAKLKAADGTWVLDSPVNNATAHYLHNCLYVLGKTRETSARPVDVQAELYRANDIENYDTAALRVHTEDGVEILFYTAHPVPDNIGPIFTYEFERATVDYVNGSDEGIVAHFYDGQVKPYGEPFADENLKIWDAVDAVRTGAPLACNAQTASAHTLCVNGAQESMPDIVNFPADLPMRRSLGESTLIFIEGLQQTLEACYDAGILPSDDSSVSWAQKGKIVDLRNYRHFPSSS